MENKRIANFELIVAESIEAKKLLTALFVELKQKSNVTDLQHSMHIDKHKLNILVTWMQDHSLKQVLND